jgi:SAM-dependent methyltransferase
MIGKIRKALGIPRTTPLPASGPRAQDAIDPSNCFTGRDTPAERTLADICRHQDMRYLLSYRHLRGEGLEIGALHFPLPVAPGVTVRYYDYRTREENIGRFPFLPPDKIVRTDYVGDGEKLELIAPESLDFLIANHMLEHCQDAIGTLKLFFSKLKPEGVLFISLPDLRYTFDFRRAATGFDHLEHDHREGPAGSLYSHYRDAFSAWSERQRADLHHLNGGSPEPLSESGLRTALAGTHADWHFHAWTQLEIMELFINMRRRHGLEFEIEACARNGIEFITVLRKTAVESFDRNEPGFRPTDLPSP